MNAPHRLALDGAALTANWQALARLSGTAACGAAVKADGYGLGARAVVARLLAAGCRDFFVSSWNEARALADIDLASAGATLSVLHGVRDEDMAVARELGARPVLNTPAQVQRWCDAGGGACDVMVDTGMNRLGIAAADVASGLLDGLALDTLMSHLACADEASAMNERQRDRFAALAEDRHLVLPGHKLPYTGKDLQQVGKLDPLIVGRAHVEHHVGSVVPRSALERQVVAGEEVAVGDDDLLVPVGGERLEGGEQGAAGAEGGALVVRVHVEPVHRVAHDVVPDEVGVGGRREDDVPDARVGEPPELEVDDGDACDGQQVLGAAQGERVHAGAEASDEEDGGPRRGHSGSGSPLAASRTRGASQDQTWGPDSRVTWR